MEDYAWCVVNEILDPVFSDPAATIRDCNDKLRDDVNNCVQLDFNPVDCLAGTSLGQLVDNVIACIQLQEQMASGQCPIDPIEICDSGDVGVKPFCIPIPSFCNPPQTVGLDQLCLSTDPCDHYPDNPCPPDPPGLCNPPATVGVDPLCISPNDVVVLVCGLVGGCPPAVPGTCSPPQTVGVSSTCIDVEHVAGLVNYSLGVANEQ